MAPLNVPVVLMEQSIDRRRCAMKLHVFTHLRPSFSPARLAVTVVFFINGFVFSNWVPRIPAIQQQLELSPGMLGLALWGIAIGALFALGLTNGLLDVAMNAQGVAVEQREGHPIFSSLHAAFSGGGVLGSVCGGVLASFGVAPLFHFC